MYTIKEVTQKLNMTVHTIRHYCDMGLVPTIKYDKHNNRLFDDGSLNWLTATRFLRESGMSIPDIKHYFDLCLTGDTSLKERYDILVKLKEKSDTELANAQYRANCISKKVDEYSKILSGEIPDNSNPLYW